MGRVDRRFYLDAETGEPHIYEHGVSEEEVREILGNPADGQGSGGVTSLPSTQAMKPNDPNEYPPGWDQARVRDVLDHYEHQTDEEAAAEHEAALSRPGETLMTIPTEIVPAVRELISRYEEEHQTR